MKSKFSVLSLFCSLCVIAHTSFADPNLSIKPFLKTWPNLPLPSTSCVV